MVHLYFLVAYNPVSIYIPSRKKCTFITRARGYLHLRFQSKAAYPKSVES